MSSFYILVAVGLWFGLSNALPTTCTEPIPPSQDPWYTGPYNFEKAAPGDVLRIRGAPGNLTAIIGNSSAAYNILYRTTDSRDRPSWAVTTLLVPKIIIKGDSPVTIVSYQSAYDTADVDGSPSYGLYTSLSETSALGIPPDSQFLGLVLERGWFVTVPDYEGPLGSFIEGPQSGHAVIDAVRASASLRQIIGTRDVQSAICGYSGGGFATAWAAELQPHYAPELKLSGATVGGLPANLDELFSNINKSPFAGLLFSAMVGVVSQFPEVNASLADSLKTSGPFNATGFFSAKTRDFVGNFVQYENQDLFAYFINDQSPLDIPSLNDLLQHQAVLGNNGVPRIPYFAFSAIPDHIAGIVGVDALVDKYCAEGATILFQRNTVGGHISEITNGGDRVFEFLESVFTGNFALDGCKVENVTVAIVTTPDPV